MEDRGRIADVYVGRPSLCRMPVPPLQAPAGEGCVAASGLRREGRAFRRQRSAPGVSVPPGNVCRWATSWVAAARPVHDGGFVWGDADATHQHRRLRVLVCDQRVPSQWRTRSVLLLASSPGGAALTWSLEPNARAGRTLQGTARRVPTDTRQGRDRPQTAARPVGNAARGRTDARADQSLARLIPSEACHPPDLPWCTAPGVRVWDHKQSGRGQPS